MKLKVICATQKNLNQRQIILIYIISKLFGKETEILLNREIRLNAYPHLKKKYINMSGELYDFSRYNSSLKNIEEESIVLAFNDTLGKGRKLNLPLYIFILVSILLINFKKYDLSGPIDYDRESKWLCPYFFISKKSTLINLNWIDYEKALQNTNQESLEKMKNWISNGWRSAKIATTNQREIKLRTLLLEKQLIKDLKGIRILSFSKYSIWRILNSIFPF